MNERWKKLLLEGKVIWTGKPEGVTLLGTAGKTGTLVLWLIAAVWIGASLLWYLPYAVGTLGMGGAQLALVLVIFNCVPLLMIMMPVSDCKSLQKETEYAITNRRVLTRSKERRMSMVLKPDTAVEVRERADGTGCVLLGEAAGKPDGRLRSLSIQGVEKQQETTGMVLYHVANPKDAVRSLPSFVRR